MLQRAATLALGCARLWSDASLPRDWWSRACVSLINASNRTATPSHRAAQNKRSIGASGIFRVGSCASSSKTAADILRYDAQALPRHIKAGRDALRLSVDALQSDTQRNPAALAFVATTQWRFHEVDNETVIDHLDLYDGAPGQSGIGLP